MLTIYPKFKLKDGSRWKIGVQVYLRIQYVVFHADG